MHLGRNINWPSFRIHFDFFSMNFFRGHLLICSTHTIFFDEVDKPKPAPDPLLIVLKRLNIDAGQCCYVGDAVEDIQMARAAGAHAFSVTTGGCSQDQLNEAGSDQVFNSLTEMVGWLSRG